MSVIISLYNAADKLPLFLTAIRSQSLLATKQMELIFIDSGSPADEYRALTATLAHFSLPYLYVRTRVRESIQTAWNRGIALARAPIEFLGVDEAVTPDDGAWRRLSIPTHRWTGSRATAYSPRWIATVAGRGIS